MFRNYITIALRNLTRHKVYSLLNILGLTVGMAICILLLLFVKYELSFDRFYDGSDRVYRVMRDYYDDDGNVAEGFASVAPSWIPLLRDDYPQIEKITRFYSYGNVEIDCKDKKIVENRFLFADMDFFDIFNTEFIEGSAENILEEPGNIILTESMARKYFPDTDPMGKQIFVDNRFDAVVAGIVCDCPHNTHMQYDFVMSYQALKGLWGEGADDYFWGTNNFSDNVTHAYIKFVPGSNATEIEKSFPEFIDRHHPSWKDKDGNAILGSTHTKLTLFPMLDIHLQGHRRAEIGANGNLSYVILFATVAIFILLIACGNYINLATARGINRAREVGLRKVIGANRGMIATQFLSESIVLVMISLFFALLIVVTALPAFASFSDTYINSNDLWQPSALLLILSITIFTGLIAGIFPALNLARFTPVSILRGDLTRGIKGGKLRRTLVVIQFIISISLLVGLGIVYRQFIYLQNVDLGYERDNIALLSCDREIINNWDAFHSRIIEYPGIHNACLSKNVPSARLGDNPGFWVIIDGEKKQSPIPLPCHRVTQEYIDTYDMKLLAGRDFSRELENDSSGSYILNETAIKRLGFASPQEAIGTPMKFGGHYEGQIIGVVADFKYESLHYGVSPMVIYIRPIEANYISVRFDNKSLRGALSHLETVWNEFREGVQFDVEFLDSRINAQYTAEEKMMKMFFAFSMLALFIVILGLTGLASFATEKRKKEIGIRKTLGAMNSDILLLLNKEFALMVIISAFVALPAAGYMMYLWLNNFAFHVNLNWFVLAGAALLTFLITILTTSLQALRAANMNPVDTLRHD